MDIHAARQGRRNWNASDRTWWLFLLRWWRDAHGFVLDNYAGCSARLQPIKQSVWQCRWICYWVWEMKKDRQYISYQIRWKPFPPLPHIYHPMSIFSPPSIFSSIILYSSFILSKQHNCADWISYVLLVFALSRERQRIRVGREMSDLVMSSVWFTTILSSESAKRSCIIWTSVSPQGDSKNDDISLTLTLCSDLTPQHVTTLDSIIFFILFLDCPPDGSGRAKIYCWFSVVGFHKDYFFYHVWSFIVRM